MAGQVPQRWISLFKEQLNEDYVYYIKYLRICNARPTYRPVDHPYMMPFTAHTRVHEVMLVSDTFTNSNVRLQTSWVDVLRTWLHKAEYTSDTLGILAGCSHIKRQNTSKGIKPLHNVHIIEKKREKGSDSSVGSTVSCLRC